MEQIHEVKRLDTINDVKEYCETEHLFIWEFENRDEESTLSFENLKHMNLGGYVVVNNGGNKTVYFNKGNPIEREGFKRNALTIFLNIVRFFSGKGEENLMSVILIHLVSNPDPVAPDPSLNFLHPKAMEALFSTMRKYEDTPLGFFRFLSWVDYEIYINTQL